ncbi:MAG: hypothetical protein WC271_13380 [Bacteroidales bacterium]|nr:hypothetical protein [Bacteroidales bacterium]NLO50899.1 hypothetical protein [Bacteroidales bacterium]
MTFSAHLKPTTTLLLLMLFLLITPTLHAQQPDVKADVTDTVFIEKGTELKIYDSTYFFSSDTTMIFHDSVIKQNDELKTYQLRQILKRKTQGNRLMRELYAATFSNPKKNSDNDSTNIEKPEKRFEPYEGKVIRKIHYKVLDAIGPTVIDTAFDTDSRFFRWLNNTYPPTKEYVIRQNLLFHEDERIEPYLMTNSERLLRELRSLNDARIRMLDTIAGTDSVDVVVIVKDIYPFGAKFQSAGIDKYNLELYTVNFMGWGHYFSNTITGMPVKFPHIRYSKFDYEVPNIGGSFIAAQAVIEREDVTRLHRLQATRKYLPIQSSWGGLAKAENKIYEIDSVYNYPPTATSDSGKKYQIHYLQLEGVAGYSYASHPNPDQASDYLVLAGRYNYLHYYDRPVTRVDTNIRYQHRTDFLGSISFVRNDYYQSKYIYGFGITEDIPYGFNLTLTAGYELAEFFNRPYGGISVSAGKYFHRFGYLYALAEAGSFIDDHQLKQGLFNFSTHYFTNLFNLTERYNTRFLFSTYYSVGINRYHNEKMYVQNLNQMRGLELYKFDGNQQLNFNTSVVTYTPWKIYGFQFAMTLFWEASLAGPAYRSIFNNKLYSGIGTGILIKNENLVFQTLMIKLSWYPNPADGNAFSAQANSRPRGEFRSFEATKPHIIPYDFYYDF